VISDAAVVLADEVEDVKPMVARWMASQAEIADVPLGPIAWTVTFHSEHPVTMLVAGRA